MKLNRPFCAALAAGVLATGAHANDRLFTYSYEPETMAAGGLEYEQWVTLRALRNQAVRQSNFARWEIRSELEYGVTDRYTVSLYLNTQLESFRDPATGVDNSKFNFTGVSIENRYLLLNPAENPVGLTLYLEPRFSGVEAELEQRLILGQRHGKWKWALNLTHATEWGNHFHKTEGELEASFGIARRLNKRWALGLELRDHNELPDYQRWENTALYLGPVLSYRNDKWWAALSVMPQVYGVNFGGNPDHNQHLDLEGHERVNIRLGFGFGF